jgi:hypothetical protein
MSRERGRLAVLVLSAFVAAFRATAAVPHLTYYGGPVLTHVKVVQVLWGAGTYSAGVADGGVVTATGLGDFFKAATNSGYVDWLREYDTPTQAIGRGTFVGRYTITPSNSNSSVADADVATELKAQIQAGHLPAPDVNTFYAVNFPSGKSITFQGTFYSCQQFCSYHWASSYGTPPFLYYAVFPYQGTSSPCQGVCGSGTDFALETQQASFQLLQAITNPQTGAGTLAWFDQSHGQICDLCSTSASSTIPSGPDGAFAVRTGWSNSRALCFTATPWPLGDADGNLTINVNDVFYLINRLFAGGPPPVGFVDVNTDNAVNVADVFYLINFLFAGGPAPF